MKKLLYRCVTVFFLIVWLIIIFWFSAQPATESQEISRSVSYRMVEACDRIFSIDMKEHSIALWAERIDYSVRKAAHITEYAILAFLTGMCMIGYWKWEKKRWCWAFLFTVGYAATDEMHQLFVLGRGARLSDVCVDMLGAVLGLILFQIIQKWMKSIAKKRGFN